MDPNNTNLKFIVTLCLFIGLCTTTISAQVRMTRSIISTTGNVSSIASSWTLGETVIGTYENGTITLSQGFQQSFNESVSVIQPESGVKLSVYPNPAGNIITVETDIIQEARLQFTLFTIQGEWVDILPINLPMKGHNNYSIDLSKIAPGIYILNISGQNRHHIADIKIIKAF